MKYVLISLAVVLLFLAALIGITLYQSQGYGNQQSEQTNQESSDSQVVTYNGMTFLPTTLTIKAGTTVTFGNTSERPMWVASNDHPTHELYPEFDTAAANGSPPKPGDDGVFTFERTGTWSYHDHNNPSAVGIIIVN